jgi:hypothetical protein
LRSAPGELRIDELNPNLNITAMLRPLLALACVAGLPLAAQTTALDFGSSNLVNLGTSLLRDSGITHTIGNDRPYSTSRMNPNFSQYFGPGFYGGYQTNGLPRENFLQAAVLEGPPGPESWAIAGGVDALSFQYRSSTAADRGLTYRVLVMFPIADGLTLGPDSTLTATLKRSGGGSAVTVRPVFAVGTNLHYAGLNALSFSSTNYSTLSFTGLSNPSNWVQMTSMTLSGTGPTFGSAITALPNEVSAIGLLFSHTMPSNLAGDFGFQMSNLNSEMNVAIPEPGTVGFLAGACALLVSILRRLR